MKKNRIKIKSSELIVSSWNIFRKKPLFLIIATFLYLSILLSFPLFFSFLAEFVSGQTNLILLDLVNFIIMVAIQATLMPGFMNIMLKAMRGEELSFDEFNNKEEFFKDYFIGIILFSIMVLVGFLFFFIPGIWLAVRLQFLNFLIVDKKVTGVAALRKSFKMSKGYGWRLFFFNIIVAPALLLSGAIFFIVGIIVTAPLLFLTYAFLYGKVESAI